MAEELLAEGNSFFVDGEFEEALEKYSQALNLKGIEDSEILSKRSYCHAKLSNLDESISDINRALETDPLNEKFLLHKGSVLFSQGKFTEAKEVFLKKETVSAFALWIRKCDLEMKLAETGGSSTWISNSTNSNSNSNSTNSNSNSNTDSTTTNPSNSNSTNSTNSNSTNSNSTNSTNSKTMTRSGVEPETKPSSQQYRHEWYQSADFVIVTVFAKDLSENQVNHSFTPQSFSLSISVEGEKVWKWEVSLCDQIDPSGSSLRIGKPKIEMKLKKANACKWETLEKREDLIVTTRNWVDTSNMNKHAYPSSSKNKKDWGELDKEAQKIIEDEKPTGDAALQKLFQDIYSKADEDTRRAMNKSFQESGGTVLSTNWKDVGSRKVDGGSSLKD